MQEDLVDRPFQYGLRDVFDPGELLPDGGLGSYVSEGAIGRRTVDEVADDGDFANFPRLVDHFDEIPSLEI